MNYNKNVFLLLLLQRILICGRQHVFKHQYIRLKMSQQQQQQQQQQQESCCQL